MELRLLLISLSQLERISGDSNLELFYCCHMDMKDKALSTRVEDMRDFYNFLPRILM